MALNETNHTDARGSLISQQLDDKEIQEILKSGTGTFTTCHRKLPEPAETKNFSLSFRSTPLFSANRTRSERSGESVD